MKTLVIPVDFTQATENALAFAAEWCKKYEYLRIILLKSVYTSMYENVIMSGEFANVDEQYLNKRRTLLKEKLDVMCHALTEKTGLQIKVQTALTELPLTRGIIEVVNQEQAVMVLVGSDAANSEDPDFISGNVIAIARTCPVRVLVVPYPYTYREVKKAIVPVDINAINSLNKINTLQASAKWKNVSLLVLNVDAKEQFLHPDEKFKAAEETLHAYLKLFNHQIYFVADKNVISGILRFEKLNEVQLMIALPGKYSFLYSLTHKSVSQALYRNSRLPVMILK